ASGAAERERLEDVRAAAESAADEQGHFASDRLDDFRQAFDRAAATLLRPAAVVRHDDAVHAVLHRELCILPRLEPFDDELQLREISEPPHDLPGQSRRREGDAAQIEAVEHGLAAQITLPAGLMA